MAWEFQLPPQCTLYAHATFATPTLGLRARYASDLRAAKTYPPVQPSYFLGSPAASNRSPVTERQTGVLKDSDVSGRFFIISAFFAKRCKRVSGEGAERAR